MQKYFDPGSDESMTTLDDVGRFTIAAGRWLERTGNNRFRELGLTISDAAPLMRLVQLGPMTPGELLNSSVLLTSAPVASHSINRLVSAGLAERQPHDSDGRSSVIAITDAGRDLAGDVHNEIYETQAEFFAPLTDSELEVLRSLLYRCLADLDG